jgi:phage terminase Nu1 subunit (DNA packaging protein)
MPQIDKYCRFDSDITAIVVHESVLAQLLQLSVKSIQKHRLNGLPVLLTKDSKCYEYDLLACIAWLQRNLDHAQSKRHGKQADILDMSWISDGEDADIELKKKRIQVLDFDLQIKQGLYIKVEDTDKLLANMAAKFVAMLRNLIKLLPNKLKSKTEAQISKILQSTFSQEIADLKSIIEQNGLTDEGKLA